jgi:hypothetical protein
MTYLERYQNGEYEAVWAELVALGEQVRQGPTLADAQAVARETMRRVRANVETLYGRLKAMGYEFQFPERAFLPPPPDIVTQMDAVERRFGPLPLSVRAWCELVGEVDFCGNYPRLAYYGRNALSDSMTRLTGALLPDIGDILRDLMKSGGQRTPEMTERLQKAARDMLNAPDITVRFQAAGQKRADEPSKPEPVVSDPLVVMLVPDIFEEYHEIWLDQMEGEADSGAPFPVEIAPDIHHKSNFSGGGGYAFTVPSLLADVPLEDEWHDTTFVNYLRICFRWGGFPGLEDAEDPPRDLIAQLTDGLLPI